MREQLLEGAPAPLALCPQTTDRAKAETWFAETGVAGKEGLVIKKPADRYRPGRPGWVKVRARDTADYVIGGVTGTLARPVSLMLGRCDRHRILRLSGQSHPPKADQRRDVAAAVQAMVFQGDTAGHPWPSPLPAGWSADLSDRDPIPYVRVEPTVVVKVEQDTAVDGPYGRLRHRCWPVRLWLDPRPADMQLPQ